MFVGRRNELLVFGVFMGNRISPDLFCKTEYIQALDPSLKNQRLNLHVYTNLLKVQSDQHKDNALRAVQSVLNVSM